MEKDTKQNPFKTIVLSIIIVIGLIGNIINLIIFSNNNSIRKISTFRYLFYLVLIDLAILIVCAGETVLQYEAFINIRLYSDLTCKLHSFLTGFLNQMKSMIQTVVNLDRALVTREHKIPIKSFLTVHRNLKQKLLKMTHFKKIIIIISILVASLNIHYLIFLRLNQFGYYNTINLIKLNKMSRIDVHNEMNKTIQTSKVILFDTVNRTQNQISSVNKTGSEILNKVSSNFLRKNVSESKYSIYMCSPSDSSFYFIFINYIWVWFDAFVCIICPIFIIIISCIQIRKNIRKNIFLGKSGVIRNRELLKILITINSYFIFTSILISLNLIYYKILNKSSSSSPHEINSFQTLIQLFAYTENSISFFLIAFSSHKYRKCLIDLFRLSRNDVESSNKTNTNSNNNFKLNSFTKSRIKSDQTTSFMTMNNFLDIETRHLKLRKTTRISMMSDRSSHMVENNQDAESMYIKRYNDSSVMMFNMVDLKDIDAIHVLT